MTNRIVNLELIQKRATSAAAELWAVVTPERLTPTTEVRGKLVGPRRPGATTLEVAYPLRPVPGVADADRTLTRRAVVTEPNLWSADAPFEYELTVELWQEGVRCDARSVTTSFKSR